MLFLNCFHDYRHFENFFLFSGPLWVVLFQTFFMLVRVSVDMSSGKVCNSLSVDGTRTVGRDIKPDVEVAQCVLQYNGVCEA